MANNDNKKMSAVDFVRQIKAKREAEGGFDYRRAALSMFPHVCTRCARGFEGKDLQQLTVHHKDGDHDNNARDGSNWELLCIYCHDDEHAREILGRRVAGTEDGGREVVKEEASMNPFADKLKAALTKK